MREGGAGGTDGWINAAIERKRRVRDGVQIVAAKTAQQDDNIASSVPELAEHLMTQRPSVQAAAATHLMMPERRG